MAEFENYQTLLNKSETLFNLLSPTNYHSILTRHKYLRPSIAQEHTSTAPDDLKTLIRSLRNLGPRNRYTIPQPPSQSEQQSEGFPSVAEVAESFLQDTHFQFSNYLSFNQERPRLMLMKIDQKISSSTIYRKLRNHNKGVIRVRKASCRISGREISGIIVFFQDIQAAISVYNWLKKKKEQEKLGQWVYNIQGSQSDLDIKWIYNKNWENEWNAVIVRGLPQFFDQERLQRKLRGLKVKVGPIKKIRNTFCAVVEIDSLLDGKNLIQKYWQLEISGRADLHHQSCMFRRPAKYVEEILNIRSNYSCERPVKIMRFEQYEEGEIPTTVETHEEGEISEGESQKNRSFVSWTESMRLPTNSLIAFGED